MYDLKWENTATTKLISFESIYYDRYGGGYAAMSFGNNFLLMDVLPNTATKKVEAEANSDMTFYFENIRFHKDNRVFFTGTASS